MSVKVRLQEAMKDALRNKESVRLECLRMAKGAILLIEKSGNGEATDAQCVAAIRSEVKKRQQSIDMFMEHGKTEEAETTKAEIAHLQEFLPQQLSAEDTETKVRAFLADNPEVNHAGKLTGMMKKELGDTVDGKTLNDVCRKVLEG
jgi:hypothetical protein